MYALTVDVVSQPNRSLHFWAGRCYQVTKINFLKGNKCASHTADTCMNIHFFFGSYFLSPQPVRNGCICYIYENNPFFRFYGYEVMPLNFFTLQKIFLYYTM
jgi:hypothetical protein